MKEDEKKNAFIPEGSELEQAVDSILETFEDHSDVKFARQAIATVLKMLKEDVSRLEWKIATAALKEMRHSFRVFAPYRDKRKVTVFGSARSSPDSPEFKAAKQFAEKISALGYMVLTGAGPGIMHAANLGAGTEMSFGLNVDLPWEQHANPVVMDDSKLINYKYFFTRKLTFIKESDALVLFPGGYGTQDEAFETLTLIHAGKSQICPIVMVDIPELNYWTRWLRFIQTTQLKNGFIDKDDLFLWTITYDVNEAVRIITEFYGNFHSHRWVGDDFVLRIKKKLSAGALQELNDEFPDLIRDGSIRQTEALAQEEEEGGIIPHAGLPRLAFKFNNRSFGRLRQLIDKINLFK